LSVNRSPSLTELLHQAESGKHAETVMELGTGAYQLDASPVRSEGLASGVVLLMLDVTEKDRAERLRREFTANVSHELKTPLQSIMGSAELLENGLVKPEDVPQFCGTIRRESARLVALVNDIIHLSQLDEGIALERETVDLLETAKDAVSALRDNAGKKGVRISVAGESVQVNGVRSLLHEMIYDLCDNAIKYNVSGGSVEIAVSKGKPGAVVTVKDTGIGIPPEYQSRVFERFFRVDKSRSKASGGTGLGLSIVKHIAQYHNANITMQSEPDVGTTVTVTFAEGGS